MRLIFATSVHKFAQNWLARVQAGLRQQRRKTRGPSSSCSLQAQAGGGATGGLRLARGPQGRPAARRARAGPRRGGAGPAAGGRRLAGAARAGARWIAASRSETALEPLSVSPRRCLGRFNRPPRLFAPSLGLRYAECSQAQASNVRWGKINSSPML